MKKGDTVIVTDRGCRPYNRIGIIIGFRGGEIGVEFDYPDFDGHSCNGKGKEGKCWYLLSSGIQLYNQKHNYEIY